MWASILGTFQGKKANICPSPRHPPSQTVFPCSLQFSELRAVSVGGEVGEETDREKPKSMRPVF
jgi:hypothetical protein